MTTTIQNAETSSEPQALFADENNEATALYAQNGAQRDVGAPEIDQECINTPISIENAIDLIGMGMFQRRITIAAGLCFAADAMEILLLSFLSLVLLVEWDLTDRQSSAITSSVFAGAFLGTLILGRLGDYMGRKPIFICTASIIAFFGMGTAFCNSYAGLIFFRFLVGFGVGGITIPFDTLAEFMPTKCRGQRLVSTSYFWTCATMLVPILAYLTLGRNQTHTDDNSDSNWRVFVACCAIPCVVSAVVGFFVVPESPRWLMLHGDSTRALAILRRAAYINGKDPSSVFPTGTQLLASEHESENASCCDLLSLYPTTLILWLLWGSYAFLYYGTVIAVTLVFSKAPNNDQHVPTDGSVDNSNLYQFDYLGMVVSSSAEMAGVALISATVDRFGRVKSMTVCFFCGGLLMFILCLLKEMVSTDADGEETHRLALIVLAFFSRLFVYSGSLCVWIVTAELFTTRTRATGHSACNAVARIGAFLAPFLVSPKEKASSIGISMFLVSILIVFCARRLPETAGQPLGVLHQVTTGQRIRVPTEESRRRKDKTPLLKRHRA